MLELAYYGRVVTEKVHAARLGTGGYSNSGAGAGKFRTRISVS
jgi:hypothetical protein